MTPVVDEVVDSTPSVDNQKKVIGERLKQARAVLKMTQKELVSESGIPLPSLRDYEGGKRMPGGDAVASLVKVGINANWLLAGHGPMLWRNLLDRARDTHDGAVLAERHWVIVRYALGHVSRHWFMTAVSDPDHGLNKVVDDYNAGRILNDEGLRRAIPSITIENLAAWGREAIAWHTRLEHSPLSPPAAAPTINVDALAHAYAVTLQTAPKGETAAQSARKAVAFYQYCWEKGLITEDGEGPGHEEGVA